MEEVIITASVERRRRLKTYNVLSVEHDGVLGEDGCPCGPGGLGE